MTNFIGGNNIQLLRNGTEYFPALLSVIEKASQEIYIQSYIYQHDDTGIKIGNGLMQAAKRGVSVNVLLDGFGSKDLPKAYIEELTRAGVKVIFYRKKISPWSLKKRRLRRLHSKIAVIDSHIGFVGGINIIDDYDIPNNTQNKTPPRIDYAVRIEGKLLQPLATSVQNLWRRMAWLHFRSSYSINIKPKRYEEHKANINAALVVRDNVLHRRDIEDAYLNAIELAKNEILIANAYFVPGRKFRTALLNAAKRGVKVNLLLQGRMEYFLMFATHAFYAQLLGAGINIYEYRKSFMHSKVAVIDSMWATVGSSNLDPFSLLLAREANVMILNENFAKELKADIESAIQDGAIRINPDSWVRGNIVKRLASWIAYGVVRALLGLVGHTHEK